MYRLHLNDGQWLMLCNSLRCACRVYRCCGRQVLQSADCQADGDGSFANKARKKGNFRDHEPETVQRLVDAYEVGSRHEQ
jgi:hypothetical protein